MGWLKELLGSRLREGIADAPVVTGEAIPSPLPSNMSETDISIEEEDMTVGTQHSDWAMKMSPEH